MRVQADILDGGPHNRQATVLRREDVDLIGAFKQIAEQALDGIGGPDIAVHGLRKLVKGQRLVFLLGQASHRFPDSFCYIWRVLVAS
jgi:hypothetical protein